MNGVSFHASNTKLEFIIITFHCLDQGRELTHSVAVSNLKIYPLIKKSWSLICLGPYQSVLVLKMVFKQGSIYEV